MRRILALATLLVAVVLSGSPATAASKPLPVPYDFLPAAILGGAPNANAPGTNDWSCKPGAAHPRPVVLVHGTFGNQATNWQTYGPLLKNNGYCVFALTYGALAGPYPVSALGGFGSMRTSAEQLRDFANRVLTATGAGQIDIVGHSQGTLMPDYYLKFLGGASKVHNYISLASLWHGTEFVPANVAKLLGIDPTNVPVCAACGEFDPTSTFMQQIRAGGAAVPGVNYVNIVTKYDELVRPYTSGIEPGMTNIVLQDHCKLDYTEHFEIAADRNASLYVLNTLDPAHPKPLTCTLTLPFVGGF
ncbi:MAG: triacylglycerol lipase [Nocardioidaceae bacterium]|nr:triacylglycerol lipase [Nocardioidaceae bacterium]